MDVPDWQKKQKEFEKVKARAKALKLRLTCTICGAKAKLNCPCETTQYCTVECQRIDWRDRGHRKACKKIRNERAAEAARVEAPTPSPSPPVYGPAPRSHADEVRARIAAEHEAARTRREANPEPEKPLLHGSVRFGSRCLVCLEDWDINETHWFRSCCVQKICASCNKKTQNKPCPLCRAPCPKDDAEHLATIRRHVENEVPEAITELGVLYANGQHGVQQNMKKAMKIWKRAAELGDLDAFSKLAYMYVSGEGGKVDKQKALRLYRTAADGGLATAQNNLAHLLLSLDEPHYLEAMNYYELAALQGLTCAEYAFGNYQNNLGRVDDARRWYARAAAKGHRESIAALENDNGMCVSEQSVLYWKSILNLGLPFAEYNLGAAYETGTFVERDLEEALRLYVLAASKGFEPANERLRTIGELLQVAETGESSTTK